MMRSMLMPLILAPTYRFTATGGVTCPTARLTVIMMPNQTGSQLKWAMMGSMKGRKT